MSYILQSSPRSGKKWRVTTPWGKNVDFGATGYSDYTLHKDSSRKSNYISRHASRENWSKDGTDTAGFWSRWLLWNLPDFMKSVKDIENRFGITIDTSAVTTNSDGSAIKNVVYVPTPSTLATNSKIVSTPPISNTSSSSLTSLPPVSNTSNKSVPPNYDPVLGDEYQNCKIEAAERKANGKLKLCPEGYCTVKLTEEVYPSYWANLKASKICSGELEDYEGNIENYYAEGK